MPGSTAICRPAGPSRNLKQLDESGTLGALGTLGTRGNTWGREDRDLHGLHGLHGLRALFGGALPSALARRRTRRRSRDNDNDNEEIQRLLTPMIRPERLRRAKEALQQRSQGARLVFCSLYEADVTACLRTMDLFGIQFGEVIGEWEMPGDTSGGAKTYVTLRYWPDLRSCFQWLTQAVEALAVSST
eukprot:Skav209880  [mRNA]  locus=scaffold3263:40778:41341:+ [translate_table: standard]